MTFAEIIERLRDGKRYEFRNDNMVGYFHKAPYPSQDSDLEIDGAHSAITYWDDTGTRRISPTFMLYDFDDDCWSIEEVSDRKPTLMVGE